MISARVLEALAILADLFGKQFAHERTVEILAADLAEYPEAAVIRALDRCRREMRTFPAVADILARIDDGRPGPQEAWAMIPLDEAASVVWTEEMAEAFGRVRGILTADPVAARMSFLEVYGKLLADARAERRPVRWVASLGHDPELRAAAIRDAESRGRLAQAEAARLLPEPKTKADGVGRGQDDGPVNVQEIVARIFPPRNARERILARRPRGQREPTDDEIEDRRKRLREQTRLLRGGAA